MLNYVLHGLLHLSLWGYVVTTLILTHITVISITIYLHRCQTHRALDLHPVASHFFRFWLWMTTGAKTKEWVAIHRKHHAKCETPDDPHSPKVFGIRKVFFEGAELYQQEAKNVETLSRYGQGTPDDWLERNVYAHRYAFGIFAMLIIDLLLFGVIGLTIWAIQMMWMPLFAAGVINGIGHYWGYRNFECPDEARNILPWSFITAGEELHNNHHTFATSAKFSVKWWEIDLGWYYIKILCLFKLAKVKRLPPKLKQIQEKSNIDFDTLTAVVINRFQVMAQYTREVILPVLREEQQKASVTGKALLKRCKVLFVRTDELLDEAAKQRVTDILEANQALRLAYQYRKKLQDIWGRTTANQRELLEALQEWCKEAEATGVNALRNFALQVRCYGLANATVV